MVDRPASITPAPDPTILTSEAIDRRVANLEAVINARLDGMEKAVEVFQADLTRVPTNLDRAISGLRELMEAMIAHNSDQIIQIREEMVTRNADIRRDVDTAFAAAKEDIGKTEDLISKEIGKLSAVTAERFVGVAAQFSERDTRTDQRAGDTKLAVDAAFAAAKEATSKIEAGFTKSIDGQQELLTAQTSATNDKISDLKDRMTAMENRTAGITSTNLENRGINQDSTTRMIAIIAIAITLAVGVAEIFTRLAAH